MKPIIEVNHVWKEYQKGTDRRYKSLRDTISSIPDLLLGNKNEKFWALEDIDFKVEAGESIGIIGRNGAGKSTLLKILSRITPPTKGEVIMRGRVASLLEVGTGFHPELTGRENIFFNGSILGMKHHEIKRKFDEIIDFSGVQSFIDTPLKHYSNGMQMRLAFSVAAHLECEILLIDEVLAVGDSEFQKRCIGKIDEVSKGEGKTILFVSHNLENISQVSKYSILLNNSKLLLNGNTEDVVRFYLQERQNISSYFSNNSINTKIISINFIKILNPILFNNDEMQLEIEINSLINYKVGIETIISDNYNNPISYASTAPMQGYRIDVIKGLTKINLNICELRLAAGQYNLQVHIIDPWKEEYDLIKNIAFEVALSDPFMSGFSFLKSYNRGATYNKIYIRS